MITMYVTYAGDAGTRFDRGHWIGVHLPLVLECWGPYGLISAAGFFPAGDGAGLIAICPCLFRDEAAVAAALAAPESKMIMDDVGKFTDVIPQRWLARPI